jgi:hypothetical protein
VKIDSRIKGTEILKSVAALEDITEEVEECGLKGIVQGVTGSLNCCARPHPRSAGVLDFAFGPQAYPNIWGVRSRRKSSASRTLKNFLIPEWGAIQVDKTVLNKRGLR